MKIKILYRGYLLLMLINYLFANYLIFIYFQNIIQDSVLLFFFCVYVLIWDIV